ncbi:conserved hypothetical protein [Sporisorium reilianum SRZ2]|uniref:Impact N-terminal domain-containing protein n=1 Tax=Sporisorium reilianum (strain SRZ2) TaxID=999809 RepID=E6ZP12_SPORE|nr:conserved hypothetical protein [Sporisorium reilianum SRZ2]
MPLRKRQSPTPSPLLDLDLDLDDVDNDSMDDELARELEEERQKILAAAGQPSIDGGGSLPRSRGDDSDSVEESNHYRDEDDEEDVDVADADDSEDEWQPPVPASKSTRRSKRTRRPSSSDDSNDDEAAGLSEDEEQEPLPKKSKTNGTKPNARAKTPKSDPPIASTSDNDANDDDEDADNSFDEEAERVQAEVEAAAAWADVRRRKEAAQAAPATTAPPSKPPPTTPSLTAWLGKGPSASSSVTELAATLPMPTTCAAAQIVDRNSLFIGYVYPLTTASPSYIATLLSHLTRVVHPTVPVALLPPQFANAPPNKRGSSHDMYAYRVLELKRARSGLAGPDDFSLLEDKEDDGERWGGDRVLRVAREQGAADVLVVVSRWYGGELLGPVRFEHIEAAASAALVEHTALVEVDELRQRIQFLDRKIARVRAGLGGTGEVGGAVEKYEGLTVEKAQRLWLARQKALDALQKRASAQAASQEQRQPAPTEEAPPVVAPVSPTSPTNEAPTQDTPDAQPPTLNPDPPSVAPHIKPEPTHDIPSTRIKDEPSPTTPNPADEDTKPTVKLEPPHDDDDLTGWDDLA